MKISILTPTYNREALLPRLYQSLLDNMGYGMEIEWLIMDDGSTDKTKEVIKKFQEEKKIEIQYFTQKNQGKMSALNALMEHVTGELMIECDSDDYFRKNAFQLILAHAKMMDEDTYALAFLKYDTNECNIGNLFEKEKTTMFDLAFKEGDEGEKALVFHSEIRKQYQYPLEKQEKFVTEALLYHQMDLKYHIQCFNEPLMICEYQKDGYSKQIQEIFKQNPYGYYAYFKEMFEHDWNGIYFRKRLYILKHYILFSTLTKKSFQESREPIKGMLNKMLFLILYLPGKILTKRRFQ